MATQWKARLSFVAAVIAAWSPMAGAQLQTHPQAQLQAQPQAQLQVQPQAQQQDVLVFEIAVLPETQKHLDFAKYPGILAIALENIGTQLTSSARLLVRDRETLEFKNSMLHFKSRQGAVFHYDASMTLSLGVADSTFRLPVEIDTGPIADGRVVARVHLTLAQLVPAELTSRIGIKIQTIATPQVQERLVAYFEELSKKRPAGKEGVEASFERILLDHFNRTPVAGGPGVREPGDAEPLSDQVLLFITLLIWLVIVPSAYLGRHLWKRRRQRRA